MRTPFFSALLFFLSVGGISAQESVGLPPGVTPALVQEGQVLYSSSGLCFACHGPTGRGVPGAGPDLSDGDWLHGDGSFDFLLGRILGGVSATESKSGAIMLPKGGSQITDDQAKAVAAYVWSLRSARNP
jgi:mono/diheme cytochrome c family protein